MNRPIELNNNNLQLIMNYTIPHQPDMELEVKTVDLGSNRTCTRTFYVPKRKNPIKKSYKDLNEHNIRSICTFLSISEMLVFRRTCKPTKLDVDKCKKQAANSIGPALMKRYELPQSLIDLIQQCEAVITGSALLNVIYNNQEEEKLTTDIDIFLELKYIKLVKEWLDNNKDKWSYNVIITEHHLRYLDAFAQGNNPVENSKNNMFCVIDVNRRNDDDDLPLIRKRFPLQFIFLYHEKPKDHIAKNFDISLVRNWFDGKKLFIGFQNDIVTRTYSMRLTGTFKIQVCAMPPKARIEKYKHRGFRCWNLETKQCSRWYRDRLCRFELSFVDSHCFYAEMSIDGCALQPFPDWLRAYPDETETKNNLELVELGRSVGMPYCTDYAELYRSSCCTYYRNEFKKFYQKPHIIYCEHAAFLMHANNEAIEEPDLDI